MTTPRLEVADVFRQHRQEFLNRWGHMLSRQQRQAFRDIVACRTAKLGVHHIEQCDRCAYQIVVYNSCRNRSCPKCHSRARDDWLAQQSKTLLPVRYCHVVFTMPHEFVPLALQNPRILYDILFRAAAHAMVELAADPKRLGAKIGFLAVLHTWTQRLEVHPHIHCVVPAGGLSLNRTRWINSRKRFFLPRKPLGRLFRGKFIAYLRRAFQEGQLQFRGSLQELAHPVRFEDWLAPLRRLEWIVCVKPPFGGPEHVLKYLARYTHRIAISNGRLIRLENGVVQFRWRDSQHGNEVKEMKLDAIEFIRRFLLHVLPGGFVKIRYFGFLSNRNRKLCLERCHLLLPAFRAPSLGEHSTETFRCPACHVGTMRVIQCYGAGNLPLSGHISSAVYLDSS